PTRAEPADNARVVQALEEFLAAAEAGTPPDRAGFLARYADVADELARCLDGLAFVQAFGPDLALPGAGPPPPGAPAGTLGDFRLVREGGRGGMGVVYEAEQLSLGRRVALKVLAPAAVLDARQRQRFQNEAQAAAHLHHPNVVPVFAVGCERGLPYYAMQF